MTYSYVIEIDDLIAFNVYYYEHSPQGRKTIWINRLLIPIIYLPILLFLSLGKSNTLLFFLLQFVLVSPLLIFWFYITPKLIRRRISKYIRKTYQNENDTLTLGKQTLVLSSDGILETSKHGETKVSWDGVQKVTETDKHIFIFSGTARGYIIPKRAFCNLEEQNSFIETLNSFFTIAL